MTRAWSGLVRKMVQQAAAEPAAFLAALAACGEVAEEEEAEEVQAGMPGIADPALQQPAVHMPPAAGAAGPAEQAAAASGAGPAGSIPAELSFVCTVCSKRFATSRGLKCHGTHAHSRQRPASCFVVSSVCPGCGNDYRTRLRALEHVERGSARCRVAVLGGGLGLVPHDLAVVAAADAADRVWRHQARISGVSELAGPPARLHRAV